MQTAGADDAQNKDAISLTIASTMAKRLQGALLWKSPTQFEQQAYEAAPEEKAQTTHHLTLSLSGSPDAIGRVLALVSTENFMRDPKFSLLSPETWSDSQKPPRAVASGLNGKDTYCSVELATVDDLRALLSEAEKNGAIFKPGDKQTAVNKATQIITNLGIAR